MRRRLIAVIFLLAVISLAGCNFLTSGDTTPTVPTVDVGTATPSVTSPPTQKSTTSVTEATPILTTTEAGPSTISDPENAILNRGELGENYIRVGTTKSFGEDLTKFQRNSGVVNVTQRTFIYNGSGKSANLIVAGVTLFTNESAAKDWVSSRAENMESKGAFANHEEISDGITATVIEFENSEGTMAVVAIHRVGDGVITVETFGSDTHYREKAIRLLLKMVALSGG